MVLAFSQNLTIRGKLKGLSIFFWGVLNKSKGPASSCFAAKSVRRDVWYLLVRARFWLRKVRKKEKQEKREKSKSQKVEKRWFLQSLRFLPFVFRKKNRKIRKVRKVRKVEK